MTDENARKKYAHLKGLIAGNLKTGNSVRDELIVSDAERHLADLIKKRPLLDLDGAIAKAKKEQEAKAKAKAKAEAEEEAKTQRVPEGTVNDKTGGAK